MGEFDQVIQAADYKKVLSYFAEISRVPRGSGFNEKISDYLVEFAKEHGLKYVQDGLKNVIIYKPATPGYEDHTGVVIQGHMDMVCIAEDGVSHDFKKEPLELFADGDWIGARGTTLGGDDGIAIAYGMALLADNEIAHPALEVVITTDEETGMDGAKGLDASLISGRFMINADSEEEGVVLVSCAGGMRVDGRLPLERVPAEGELISIKLSGLTGGHSGAEIHKYRTNAVYLMARLLFDLKNSCSGAENLFSFAGGEKDNAIPSSAQAQILVKKEVSAAVREKIEHLFALYQKELSGTEPDLSLSVSVKEAGVLQRVLESDLFHTAVCAVSANQPGLAAPLKSGRSMTGSVKEAEDVMAVRPADFEKLLFLLLQAPDGVQKMSGEIEGLVESSLNLGIFSVGEREARFRFSLRSSVGSYKYFLRDKLCFLFDFVGGGCEADSGYPAWEYRRDSVLREKFTAVFEDFYGKKPEIRAIHAGLECGLICEKIPEMDIVSIGPDMRDIHTPKERLSISSSLRVYRFLERLLAAL